MIPSTKEKNIIEEQCRKDAKQKEERQPALEEDLDVILRDDEKKTEETVQISDSEQLEKLKCFMEDEIYQKIAILFENVNKASSNEIIDIVSKADTKLQKILELYDSMIEYKNQCNLLLLKIFYFYEKIVALNAFCSETFNDIDDEHKSLLLRISSCEKMMCKALNSFGMVPVIPSHNEPYNATEHEIIAEIEQKDSSDIPGNIAECLKAGMIRNGVVVKTAQVTVYKTQKNIDC